MRNNYALHNQIARQWWRFKPRGTILKKLFALSALAFFVSANSVSAQSGIGYNSVGGVGGMGSALSGGAHTSSGYTNNHGTYVQPYVATNPNSTQRDNFSASGNVNPYNGNVGTRAPRY